MKRLLGLALAALLLGGAAVADDGDVLTFVDPQVGGKSQVFRAPLVQQKSVHVTAAQILTAFSAPAIQLVAAPGAGKLLVPVAPVFSQASLGLTRYLSGGNFSITQIAGVLTTGYPSQDPSKFVGFAAEGPITMWFIHGEQGDATDYDLENKPLLLWMDTADPILVGPIVTSTKQDGGAGYAPGDSGTVDDPNTGLGDAVYVVDTVDGGGAVLTYHLTNNGTHHYTPTNNPYPTIATSGGGTGFTVNVTAIPAADTDFWLTFSYTVVTLH